MISAPASAKTQAMPPPIPPFAPVTSAVFPVSSKSERVQTLAGGMAGAKLWRHLKRGHYRDRCIPVTASYLPVLRIEEVVVGFAIEMTICKLRAVDCGLLPL